MTCPKCNNPYECPCGAPVCREQTAGLEQTWEFDSDDTVCLACGFRASCSWWLDYDFHLTWPEKYPMPEMPVA